jgi:hypothetical protein
LSFASKNLLPITFAVDFWRIDASEPDGNLIAKRWGNTGEREGAGIAIMTSMEDYNPRRL